MLKIKSSWCKPNNIPNLIARKKVDWSIFENGTTIPVEFHEDFNQANGRTYLNRGDKHELILIFEGQRYNALIINVDRKDIATGTFQIRYDTNKKLKKLLFQKFKSSYLYLKAIRDTNTDINKKIYAKVPDSEAEFIDFYDTGVPFQYRIELLSRSLYLTNIEKQNLSLINEQELEKFIESYDNNDDFAQWIKLITNNASIEFKQKIVKVRKYQRSVILTLKSKYEGACQICGFSSKELYGIDICQGHHIEYFAKSLNNLPTNIAILCPTHHALIHATNATFNRSEKCFICDNGQRLELILNYHL